MLSRYPDYKEGIANGNAKNVMNSLLGRAVRSDKGLELEVTDPKEQVGEGKAEKSNRDLRWEWRL
jgi:hypothetical protein